MENKPMAKKTAHLTGCGPDESMSKWERLKKFQKDYDKLGFTNHHHGHEVLVHVGEDDKIRLTIKIQESLDTSRTMILCFDTQSQMERLFPSIMKGMNYVHR
jgi:hypothetical protein